MDIGGLTLGTGTTCGSHLIRGSLNHKSQSPNGISIGSAICAQLTCVPNTDTQTTLRATSVATGRIYAVRGGDAA